MLTRTPVNLSKVGLNPFSQGVVRQDLLRPAGIMLAVSVLIPLVRAWSDRTQITTTLGQVFGGLNPFLITHD